MDLAADGHLEAAGQDARKYSSRNPVVRRLLDRWLHRLRLSVFPVPLLVDVGAGEGIATARIAPPAAFVVAVDLHRGKLLAARERLPGAALVQADAGLLPFPDGAAPGVTCVEVLEHLTNPDVAVMELARICAGRCVVSVPWEPWFRFGNLLRGKNLARLGNDPEHAQWYRPGILRDMLRAEFGDVTVRRCFPWLVAVAQGGWQANRPPARWFGGARSA